GARIAIHADRAVVPAQNVVGAGLAPELPDEAGIVDDVAETCDRATARALELVQRRQKLSVWTGRHEVGDEQVGRDRPDRVVQKLGSEGNHVSQRQLQIARRPGSVAVYHLERRELNVGESV